MSSELIKCDSCRGSKRILGMGGIYNTCEVCNGVGWNNVEIKDKDKMEKDELKVKESRSEVKRRGRPKRSE